MKARRTGPSQRTAAERAAIDAWERPISAWQLEALRCMAKKPLSKGRAGWGSELLSGKYWQSQTILALIKRGFCNLDFASRGRFARITPKGRMEIKRHSVREGARHAWGLPR